MNPQSGLTKFERMRRIDGLLDSFGLRKQQHTLIGTPIRSGISGGQKRRVSVASQLITAPKILFLDEPTSGLDSLASWEVISFIKKVARENNLIVIMSIHQPSTKAFQLFDKALLLSAGKSYYFGSVIGIKASFDSLGCPMPPQMNPAEFVLDILNTDFAGDQESAGRQLEQLQYGWAVSAQSRYVTRQITAVYREPRGDRLGSERLTGANFFAVVAALVHRSWIKSYRDMFAYGVRIAMYTGKLWRRSTNSIDLANF
jgi:ABC-type multidrug transport system ATPase subunit